MKKFFVYIKNFITSFFKKSEIVEDIKGEIIDIIENINDVKELMEDVATEASDDIKDVFIHSEAPTMKNSRGEIIAYLEEKSFSYSQRDNKTKLLSRIK